jgi:DNA-binding GntR family transcriptional regulator
MSPLEAVPKPTSLTESAYEALREAILDGELRPGEPLSVVAVSQKLAMSRSPARAAVERLVSEGLLEDIGNGFVVADLTAEDLFDSMAVRELLEGPAAELAVPRFSPAALDQLGQIHDQFVSAYARSDAKAGMRADHAFHQLISSACGNRALVEHLGRIQSRILVVTYGRAWSVLSKARAVPEHAAILAAIRVGDPLLTRMAATAHVNAACERLQLEWKPATAPRLKDPSRGNPWSLSPPSGLPVEQQRWSAVGIGGR